MDKERLHLDVAQVLQSKMPRYSKYVPKILVNWLAKTICQDELNDILMRHGDKSAIEFSKCILNDLDIKLTVKGIENIPDKSRLVFASNHPLGGLDGIALIALLGSRYPDNFRFIVNDILMAIPTYNDIFLPVNKHGRQNRHEADLINTAYLSDNAIATFPAGLCSRNLHGKSIEDLKWKKAFITKSIEYQRDIVPVFVKGRNSNFFYHLAKIRRRLGVKFNIEMIYLPSEIFKYRGKELTICFGKPISWTTFDDSRSPRQWAAEVRARVYNMENNV